jgi:hypothetical protein
MLAVRTDLSGMVYGASSTGKSNGLVKALASAMLAVSPARNGFAGAHEMIDLVDVIDI